MISSLLLFACMAHSQPAGGEMTDFDAALSKLGSRATWCDGAEVLARLGDPRAIVPIMNAYRSMEEGGKVCLIEALKALNAGPASHELYAQGERVIALHLMSMFPDDSHLPLLEPAADDADDLVRFTAIRALSTQLQTPGWEVVMIRLLDSPRLDVRRQAVDSLSRRKTDTARAALKARVDKEPDARLRSRIELVVGE
jgi:HEAT repeat protein